MTIYYPDISGFQAGIDLKGALAVSCKATEGVGYTNSDYARAKANAASHGTFFFAYHFLHAGDAAGQARYCFDVVGKTPIMLDVEPVPGSDPSIADVLGFVSAFRALGGTIHLIYLPEWYWAQMGRPNLATAFKDAGLYLVSSVYTGYTDNLSGAGWLPYGGFSPSVWQYADAIGFNGFSVDFNAFRGHYAGKQDPASVAACLKEFIDIVTTGGTPAPPPPPASKYSHVVPSGNTHSLASVIETQHRVYNDVVSLTKATDNAVELAVFEAYLALDAALVAARLPHPPMPEGMVYWTYTP